MTPSDHEHIPSARRALAIGADIATRWNEEFVAALRPNDTRGTASLAHAFAALLHLESVLLFLDRMGTSMPPEVLAQLRNEARERVSVTMGPPQ